MNPVRYYGVKVEEVSNGVKIYNSLTRKKEEFEPLNKGKAGMYVCGPTVYDEPHIGHARSAFIFDVIRRYLEYKDYEVMFVRNVTDVDDKIIEKARKGILAHEANGGASGGRGSGTGLVEETAEIAKKYLDSYHADMAALGILPPTKEPKATEYIPKMIKFIVSLIEREAAYVSGGDVYFDIKKAKHYGKLSNQDIGKMEAGVKVSPGEKKKDPLDFALWKKAKEGEPSWPSPWEKGRPGWHIECSAMSSDILGNEFDIHGGGIDLIFPHHENEIAQSEGAGKKFARYWMHNGLLTINNEKMAKSLGNFISIKDFLAKYKDPDYLKLLFLNTHYRHPVDYTEDKIAEMKAQKERFVILLEKLNRVSGTRTPDTGPRSPLNDFGVRFEEAMDDDFNTPLALASLFDLVTYANKQMESLGSGGIRDMLIRSSKVLGLDLSRSISASEIDDDAISELIRERDGARENKDFKKSDEIRKRLVGHGIILEDTKDGTVWRRKI
jgi:cysteinyl-tRNA synthetase